MKLLPLAGLSGAAVLSTIALTDALWQGFQHGAPAPWHSPEGYKWMGAGMDLGHALPYLLLAITLIRIGPKLDTGGYVRWLRRLLVLTFSLFAAMILWGVIAGEDATALGALEIVPGILFLALLVLPIMLGAALLRRRALRVPAVLLAGSLLPIILMIGMSAMGGSPFAHPAYAEIFTLFGVALLPFALEEESINTDTRSRPAMEPAEPGHPVMG